MFGFRRNWFGKVILRALQPITEQKFYPGQLEWVDAKSHQAEVLMEQLAASRQIIHAQQLDSAHDHVSNAIGNPDASPEQIRQAAVTLCAELNAHYLKRRNAAHLFGYTLPLKDL